MSSPRESCPFLLGSEEVDKPYQNSLILKTGFPPFSERDNSWYILKTDQLLRTDPMAIPLLRLSLGQASTSRSIASLATRPDHAVTFDLDQLHEDSHN